MRPTRSFSSTETPAGNTISAPRLGTRRSTERPGRRRHVLLSAMFASVLLLLPLATVTSASAQVPQGVGLGITPIYPSLVIVGDTGVVGQLSIINNSTGVGSVTLTSITLNPACLDLTCVTPDLGVLQLSPTGIGVAGTCTGMGFTIAPGVGGAFTFTPTTPVILTPPSAVSDLDTCLITFSFDVLKAPVLDGDVVSPGLQTRAFATTGGFAFTDEAERLEGTGTGTTLTTVGLRETDLTTRASGAVPLGSPISDTATLTGGFNPTGTITFTLYGPNNAECTGGAIFTSVVPVVGNGSYVSAPFVPVFLGTYRWIASYSGDANNGPVTTSCADPLEAVLVSAQVITTTTTVPPVTTTLPPQVGSVTSIPPPPLARTGSDLPALAAVAALLLAFGAHLVTMSVRRRKEGWPSW